MAATILRAPASIGSIRGGAALSLRELFPRAQFLGTGNGFGGGDDIRVRGCASDWHHVRPGDLYVAFIDAEHDGHDAVDLAIARGASGVLCERVVPQPIPQCVVDDVREALGVLSHALAGNPSHYLSMYGIGGTDGKTSASLLLASILRQAGRRPAIDVNEVRADQRQRLIRDSNVVQRAARAAVWVLAGHKAAVLEIETSSLARRHLAGTQFDFTIVTNTWPDERDESRVVERGAALHRRLLERLKPQGTAILNADDPATWQWLDDLEHPAITYGMREAAQVRAELVERTADGQTFHLIAGPDAATIQIPRVGQGYIYACLAASAAGLASGVDFASVVRGIERCRPSAGCLEPIDAGQPFAVYVDAADTSHRLHHALAMLRQVTRRRLTCVLAVPADIAPAAAASRGRTLDRGCDHIVLTNRGEIGTRSYEPFHRVIDGFGRPARPWIRPDRRQAIRDVLEQARPGDTVLLAGMGRQPYAAEPGEPVSDDVQQCWRWLGGGLVPSARAD